MHRYVNELGHGDSVKDVYLVAERHLRANRNGNLYLQLELRDRTGTISSRMWNASESMYGSIEDGEFVTIEGKVQSYQGALQIILNRVHPASADDVEMDDFLPRSQRELDQLERRLRHLLMDIANPHLRALAECFLLDEALMRRFAMAPAGVRHHHAYLGGLLEHVVNIMETAERIIDLYPALDRDVLLMGAFLHDIGKTGEFSYDRAFQYTDEGQLIGHLVMGVALVDEKVKQSETLTNETFPVELALRLKHMIVSHHGDYAFGSPKLPMTPEALALHYLDSLDAKLHCFSQQIREDLNPSSAWTAYFPSLGRKLFKGYRDHASAAAAHPSDLVAAPVAPE